MASVPTRCIHNGIDTEQFRIIGQAKERIGMSDKKVVLAVASKWTPRKGFDDVVRLRELLDERFSIVVVGLADNQKRMLPSGIVGITRTNSVDELALYYSAADVFINPTYEDSLPTTNMEALACGTPIVTYETGGSPEVLDESTGIVVPRGDLSALVNAIRTVSSEWNRMERKDLCRNRAVHFFKQEDRYREYYQLYQSLLKKMFHHGLE